MPNDPFYKLPEYKAWRAEVFAQAKHDGQGRPLCARCLRFGRRTPATVAHHRIPRKARPDLAFDPANGEPLCAACHNEAHDEKGRAPRHPPLSPKRYR